MPLWDFRCANDECEHVVTDRYMTPGRDVPQHCGKPMVKMTGVPAPAQIKGFSAKNGYAGGQTYEVKTKDKNTRVIVKS
jgi:hypothetical protein